MIKFRDPEMMEDGSVRISWRTPSAAGFLLVTEAGIKIKTTMLFGCEPGHWIYL